MSASTVIFTGLVLGIAAGLCMSVLMLIVFATISIIEKLLE